MELFDIKEFKQYFFDNCDTSHLKLKNGVVTINHVSPFLYKQICEEIKRQFIFFRICVVKRIIQNYLEQIGCSHLEPYHVQLEQNSQTQYKIRNKFKENWHDEYILHGLHKRLQEKFFIYLDPSQRLDIQPRKDGCWREFFVYNFTLGTPKFANTTEFIYTFDKEMEIDIRFQFNTIGFKWRQLSWVYAEFKRCDFEVDEGKKNICREFREFTMMGSGTFFFKISIKDVAKYLSWKYRMNRLLPAKNIIKIQLSKWNQELWKPDNVMCKKNFQKLKNM